MLRSLVGSEMCIRDRLEPARSENKCLCAGGRLTSPMVSFVEDTRETNSSVPAREGSSLPMVQHASRTRRGSIGSQKGHAFLYLVAKFRLGATSHLHFGRCLSSNVASRGVSYSLLERIDLLHFSPAGYPTQHVVTRTLLLSLRVPVYCLFSRIQALTIHSHTSTFSPPRQIQRTRLYNRTGSLARTIQHSPLTESK